MNRVEVNCVPLSVVIVKRASRGCPRACEASDPVMNKDVESSCRCHPLMLMLAEVPYADMQKLASNFSMDGLETVAKRYPSYRKLSANCFD